MHPLHDVEVPAGMMTTTGTEDHPPETRYYFIRDRIGWGILALLALQAGLIAWNIHATYRAGNLAQHGG